MSPVFGLSLVLVTVDGVSGVSVSFGVSGTSGTFLIVTVCPSSVMSLCWISVIRLPDFVNQKDFEWAVETATKKKKIDCSSAEFVTIDEGLCVQIMHLGAFDDEPVTVALTYNNDWSSRL